MKPFINRLLIVAVLVWIACPLTFAQSDSIGAASKEGEKKKNTNQNSIKNKSLQISRQDSVTSISIVVDESSKTWLQLDKDSMGYLFANKKKGRYVLMPTKKYVQIHNRKNQGTKFKIKGKRFDDYKKWGREITDSEKNEFSHSILLLNDFLIGGNRELTKIDDTLSLYITSPVKFEKGFMELLLATGKDTTLINMTKCIEKIPTINNDLTAVIINASPINLWAINSEEGYHWENPVYELDGTITQRLQQTFQADNGDTITIKFQTPQDFVDEKVSEFTLIIGNGNSSGKAGESSHRWPWWVLLTFVLAIVLTLTGLFWYNRKRLLHLLKQHKSKEDSPLCLIEKTSDPKNVVIPHTETEQESIENDNTLLEQPLSDIDSLSELKEGIPNQEVPNAQPNELNGKAEGENNKAQEQLQIVVESLGLDLGLQSGDIKEICKKRIEELRKEGSDESEQQLNGLVKRALGLDENCKFAWEELKDKIDSLVANNPQLTQVKDYLKNYFETHKSDSVPRDILKQMAAMDNISRKEGEGTAQAQLQRLQADNKKLSEEKLTAERMLRNSISELKEAMLKKDISLSGAINPDYPENAITQLINTIQAIELAKDAEEEKEKLNKKIEELNQQIQQFPETIKTEKKTVIKAEEEKWKGKITNLNTEIKQLKSTVSQTRNRFVNQLHQRIVAINELITNIKGNFVRNGNTGEVLEGLLTNLTLRFSSFRFKFEDAQRTVWTKDRITCDQVEKDVAHLALSEMSATGWINIVEQLKAYSDLEALHVLFKECALSTTTLTQLDAEVRCFLGMLGYALLVPRLQVDTFNKKDFDYNNSGNLTIKMLAPDIKPAIGKVFELLQIGYIHVADGTRQNPQVVYSI